MLCRIKAVLHEMLQLPVTVLRQICYKAAELIRAPDSNSCHQKCLSLKLGHTVYLSLDTIHMNVENVLPRKKLNSRVFVHSLPTTTLCGVEVRHASDCCRDQHGDGSSSND